MPAATRDLVSLAEATRAWFVISLQTFGERGNASRTRYVETVPFPGTVRLG